MSVLRWPSLLAALLALFGLANQSSAHARLVWAAPAANSTVKPPTELRLKFSERFELKFTKVRMTGPDNRGVRTGPVRLDARDSALLIVPLGDSLPDGKYTVHWDALSIDGHKIKGTYSFTSMQ